MHDLDRVKDPCALLKRSISIWMERPSQNKRLVTWQVSSKQYVEFKKRKEKTGSKGEDLGKDF